MMVMFLVYFAVGQSSAASHLLISRGTYFFTCRIPHIFKIKGGYFRLELRVKIFCLIDIGDFNVFVVLMDF